MENLQQAYRRSIGLGAGMQGVELLKYQQEGTANPPSKIRMLPLDLLDAFLPTHFVDYLNNLMSVLGA
jgi:hypothetical protein